MHSFFKSNMLCDLVTKVISYIIRDTYVPTKTCTLMFCNTQESGIHHVHSINSHY